MGINPFGGLLCKDFSGSVLGDYGGVSYHRHERTTQSRTLVKNGKKSSHEVQDATIPQTQVIDSVIICSNLPHVSYNAPVVILKPDYIISDTE